MRPRFSTMVVDICNTDLTYNVKQLTASCVDETSVHFGFMVDNDWHQYNCCVTQEIGYRGNIPTKFLSWRGLKLTSSCH